MPGFGGRSPPKPDYFHKKKFHLPQLHASEAMEKSFSGLRPLNPKYFQLKRASLSVAPRQWSEGESEGESEGGL